MALPLLLSQAKAANLQDARWVTRTDAPVPYVRMVMDLSTPVKAAASISKDGKTTTVTLNNTKLKTAKNTIYMDSSIASVAQLSQVGKDVAVTIKTPSALDTNDVKVFSLKKDTVNQKPYRIVVDVQKKGVNPKPINYGKKPSPATAPASSKGSGKYSVSGGLSGKVITIDPGHGGDDPGAVVTFSEKHEADHTLTTALLLKKELENLGATVILTRESDKSVSLENRAQLSNREKANAFISLHFDSGPNSNASGTTGYYFASTSENLGQTVNKYIARNLTLKSQGTKFQNFLVLRENKQPSILLELGYLNNPDDNKLIESTEYQENIAKSIASALKEYFQQ